MSKRTEKAGTSGKFGARYGVVVRNRIKTIEAEQKKNHECPVCHHDSVKRVASGIWACKRCGAKFAAAAYSPIAKKTEQVTAE
jgi:large subunit ribosomal protein L37Ae